VFVPAVILRWAGGDAVPRELPADGAAETTLGFYGAMLFLLPGISLCLVGVVYPAAVMRLAALRVWWHHLMAYRRLSPLWTELNARFPQDALSRVPVTPWRDLSPRGVHRRYYRRVIECRDGLVRISPYLTDGPDLATSLKQALQAHTFGDHPAKDAVPVAIPERAGLDADVDELVTLSHALRGQTVR
jgi:hypothetical protein